MFEIKFFYVIIVDHIHFNDFSGIGNQPMEWVKKMIQWIA